MRRIPVRNASGPFSGRHRRVCGRSCWGCRSARLRWSERRVDETDFAFSLVRALCNCVVRLDKLAAPQASQIGGWRRPPSPVRGLHCGLSGTSAVSGVSISITLLTAGG